MIRRDLVDIRSRQWLSMPWPARFAGVLAPGATLLARSRRREFSLAGLRLGAGFVTLLVPGGTASPVLVAPTVTAFLLVTVLGAMAVCAVSTSRHVDTVGRGLTFLDASFYGAFQVAFHETAGSASSIGLLAVVASPLRRDHPGTLISSTLVGAAAVRWPPPGGMSTLGTVLAVVLVTTTTEAMVRFQRRGADALERAQARLAAVFDVAVSGFGIVDDDGRILELNPSFARLLGAGSSGEVVGRAFQDFVHPSQRLAPWGRAAKTNSGRIQDRDVRLLDRHGEERWATMEFRSLPADGGQRRILVQLHDVSQRRATERRLVTRATRDPLTGVLNRSEVLAGLQFALQRQRDVPHALLFIDLDRFKQINDGLGHGAGDTVLKEVASRLTSVVRTGDAVGRLGGDEFVIATRPGTDVASAMTLARRVDAAIRRPVDLGDGTTWTAASIGVAVSSKDTPSAESLLDDADTAMYNAKLRGGREPVLFDQAMRDEAHRRHEIEVALRVALDAGALSLNYQPLVSLHTGEIIGFEALLRWQQGGQDASTAEVVAIAEESDLVVDLDAWVLRHALRERFRTEKGSAPEISVNVSPRTLARPEFSASVAAALEEAGADASELCLEVTETALVEDVGIVAATLIQLRALGVRVAIDDFGTGHASLTYLARLPVDWVKIDRTFVTDVATDDASRVIVESVVAMAHALRLHVVAEGVETLAQLEVLLDVGCDVGQGWLFARAMHRGAAASALVSLAPWPVELTGRRARSRAARVAPLPNAARQYRLLLDLGREVTAELEIDTVLARSFAALHRLVAFTGGSIQLVDGDSLRIAAAEPSPTPEAMAARLPIGQGIGGTIALTGEPVYIADIVNHGKVPAQRRRSSTSAEVRSYFGAPLVAAGSIIGVLQIDSVKVDAFSEHDRLLLLAFAPLIAAAVHNATRFDHERRVHGVGEATG